MRGVPTPPAIDITDLPVERVPLAALRPDPKNARRHGQQNLDAIRKSLEAFGQRRPLVTDKTGRTVIAGNGTLEVMGELGWETAWITRFPGTAAQARAFAVADNRTAELAEWDFSILMVRNEIVWDKGSGIGMRSAAEHSIPTATERCLLLMRGTQFLGNQNKDDYWEGYEPLRAWLNTETGRLGWTAKDLNALTSTQMAGHWLSKSQFSPIPQRHYETLQEAAGGKAFTLSYDELFGQLFPDIKGGGNQHRRNISAKLREVRTHFDNTHDAMTDVWRYPRVTGEERYGHATPKPVAMVERAVLTSSREGDVIAAPFSGTGPEFIAAHRTGRVCVGMELSREYADLICRRWQQHTGIVPVLEATGAEHDFL